MSTYFFLFGNTPELSWLELQSLVPEAKLLLPDLGQLDFTSDDQADEVFNKLGGSVKAVRQVKVLDRDADLVNEISQYLAEQESEGKLTYSLAIIEDLSDETVLELDISETQIKKSLKDLYSTSSRYIEHKKTGLSASVLLHQAVKEVALINLGDKVILARTALIQNIDDWTNRDRNKPYADRKKGMLPPKVARMMANIAVGSKHSKIYDPFCGTGTVLAEAMMLGHEVVGSDQDGKATAGAEKNLDWLKNQYSLQTNYKIFLSDVSGVKKMSNLNQTKVDAIVTEPYLGKPKPQLKQLDNIFKGLEKLYLGAFKVWREVLKDGAKVVIVFPQVVTHKKTYNFDKFIDKLSQLGYTTTSEAVLYARQGAVVQRQIYTFEFKK